MNLLIEWAQVKSNVKQILIFPETPLTVHEFLVVSFLSAHRNGGLLVRSYVTNSPFKGKNCSKPQTEKDYFPLVSVHCKRECSILQEYFYKY